MVIEKIQPAGEVLDAFMGEQSQDESLDQATVAVVDGLSADDKLIR